jgi:hypothetical protein
MRPHGRTLSVRLSAMAIFCSLGPLQSAGVQGAAIPGASGGDGQSSVAEYDAKCPAVAEPSFECELLRSAVVAEVVVGLEDLESSGDQRAVPFALRALDVDDEPAIQVAAVRILGQFPDDPGIKEKAVALLLESPYYQVEEMAAHLLDRAGDPRSAPLGGQWANNHNGPPARSSYDEIGFPEHYDAMKFPEYPGMARFTPGDSDRSVSWWTTDPPAAVVKKLEQTLGVKSIAYAEWSERQQARMAKAMEIDPAKQEEMEKLTEEFGRTQDMKVLTRLQTLQQEIYAPMQKMGDAAVTAVDTMLLPPVPAEQFGENRLLVAEEKGGHAARVVLVYRQPLLDRTILQMTWDLADYPSAWGEPDSD